MIIEFKEYQRVKAAQIDDANYDCEEIAEDLVEIYKDSLAVYKIYTKPMFTFNVKEHGENLEVTHHYFAVVEEHVLDPRWNTEPVPFDKYMEEFYAINTEKTLEDVRVLLMPDFNPYNPNAEGVIPISTSSLFEKK